MTRLAILIGSTRPGRRAPAVAQWVARTAKFRAGVEVEILDLAEFALPLLDEPVPPAMAEHYTQEHTRRWAAAVDAVDGFLFVTPEYNHAIPGALKNALDFLHREWNDKAAGFVSYGSAGGVRAVEQLRLVMGELRVADVRAQVSLNLVDDFDSAGLPAPREFHHDALADLVDQLTGWSAALAALRGGQFAGAGEESPVAAIAGPRAPRSGGQALTWAHDADALYPDFRR
jgi:NAD(P)H-dependent FMN reductase